MLCHFVHFVSKNGLWSEPSLVFPVYVVQCVTFLSYGWILQQAFYKTLWEAIFEVELSKYSLTFPSCSLSLNHDPKLHLIIYIFFLVPVKAFSFIFF